MANKDLSYYMGLTYRMDFILELDGPGYTILIPDLKGCISFCETLEEADQMITEAKRLWIETALDKGWEVPEPQPPPPASAEAISWGLAKLSELQLAGVLTCSD